MSEEDYLRSMVVKVNDSSPGTVGTDSMDTSRSAITFESEEYPTFSSQISKAIRNIFPSFVSRPIYARPYSVSQDDSIKSIRSLREQLKEKCSHYSVSSKEYTESWYTVSKWIDSLDPYIIYEYIDPWWILCL